MEALCPPVPLSSRVQLSTSSDSMLVVCRASRRNGDSLLMSAWKIPVKGRQFLYHLMREESVLMFFALL